MRVLFLTRYGRRGASSRYRTFQFLPAFEESGIDPMVCPLLDDEYLGRKYEGSRVSVWPVVRSYLRRARRLFRRGEFDLVWVEKECFPWIPFLFEKLLLPRGVPIVVDYDDAVFHRYDQHSSRLVRKFLARKIRDVMTNADAVVVGNDYLRDYAVQAGAREITVIPTAVDVEKYTPSVERENGPFRIGWVGSPATQKYLAILDVPLRELAAEIPMEFVVIGTGEIQMEGVPVRNVEWSDDTEAEVIATFDVGVMPVDDDPWARGKCGLKLLQYMAAGLPVVASPVGANRSIVDQAVDGFLADSAEEWRSRLIELARDPELRMRMGLKGRGKVEREFGRDVVGQAVIEVMRSVVSARGPEH